MILDQHHAELKAGYVVVIPCRIIDVAEESDVNLTLESLSPGPSGSYNRFGLHSGQVALVGKSINDQLPEPGAATPPTDEGREPATADTPGATDPA